MRKLGLVGGTSWVSTIDYYRFINEGINAQLGGLNFANCLIYSFNYADIAKNTAAGNWDIILDMFTEACTSLQQAGAEAIVLCANTPHKIAGELAQRISLPIIHIAVETAKAIQQKGLKTVALLGTKFTMEFDFFKDELAEYGIKVLIPDEADREYIHSSIHDELAKGIITTENKTAYLRIIDKLIAQGAEGVILGCTEIPLLIKQEDVSVPAFDTTMIHSQAAVAFALS